MRGELIRADGDALVLTVHVQPRAGTTAITGLHGDALKIRVAAPPVEGRATEAARLAIAAAFDLPPAAVELVSGERSRLKRFRLHGIALADAKECLARALGG
ncbi:MAG TPA: DUF167 family protein [Acidimicrobiia bacterium]|nr:DUF167 family protein [Acidimicrobiia bacterium]